MEVTKGDTNNKKQIKLDMKDNYRYTVNILMNQIKDQDKYAQISYKKGLNVHRNTAVQSMLKVFTQIGEDDKRVFILVNANKLIRSRCKRALK